MKRAFAILALAAAALIASQHRSSNRVPAVHFVTSTKKAAAQKAFDEGLKWLYGFNHEEAVNSFRRASELDPKMAMAHWGIALALGPNINLDVDPEREKQAYEETAKAAALKKNAWPRERAYIDALSKRYSIAPDADLKKLSADYSSAMRDVMKRYPDDLDAATLWAESAMDLRPWKLWNPDGTPAEGTDAIVAALESVLKRNPNHLGANHYYIHAVEASPHPERALASARRIPGLAPDAGHLVHMPAHIFMRTGDYAGASVANERAADVDRTYIAKHGPQGVYPMMYYNHNLDFLAAARAMEGRHADAKKAAEMLRDNVAEVLRQMPEMAPMIEPFLARPLGIALRFGEWDDVMWTPQPNPSHPFESAFWHFARGAALAANSDITAATKERDALHDAAARLPADAMVGLNSAANILAICDALLESHIARATRDSDAEIAALQRAVNIDDTLAYDEPPDFYFPTREALGGALLRAGNATEAEKVFRADLAKNPDNPRSLFGLAEALRAQKRTAEADATMARQQKLWSAADTKLSVGNL